MPQIKIDYIVSFSSEHPDHPASNLLLKDISNKRWTCLSKGEGSLSIVFQLEKAVQISSVTIGNYHSALIEVLVGSSESPQQYEVLICTSCFMSPKDSRDSTNISNVKSFTTSQLAQDVQSKKWDRVRVVCKQPYNKHVQYGLSFIQLFCSDPVSESNSQPSTSKMLGKFKLKDDSDEADISFKPGEMFSKAKLKQTLPTDAEIRKTAIPGNLNNSISSELLVKGNRPNVTNFPSTSGDGEVLSRKRDKLMYIDDDDEPDEKIDKIIAKDREIKLAEKNKNLPKQEQKQPSKITRPSDVNGSPSTKNKEKNQTSHVKGSSKLSDVNTSPSIKHKEKNQTTNLKGATKLSDVNSSPSNKQNEKNQRMNTDNINGETNSSIATNSNKRPNTNASSPAAKKQCTDADKNQIISNFPRGDNCLKGVIFVISGYVNPQRGNLRDTAISLGARYRPDWDRSCTHLICAFPNTPKHDQVKRTSPGGIVVTGQWIEECGKERAHLPWKWYATDPKLRVKRSVDVVSVPLAVPSTSRDPQVVSPEKSPVAVEDDEDTDDEIARVIELSKKMSSPNKVKKAMQTFIVSDNESNDEDTRVSPKAEILDKDTDDEIARVIELSKKMSSPNRVKNAMQTFVISDNESDDEKTKVPLKPKILDESEIFEIDTDSGEEKDKTASFAFNEDLPDIFAGIKFYIDPKLINENEIVSELKRYIVAYKGTVIEEWPNKSVDVAISSPQLAEKLKEKKEKKCMLVKPEWIWMCHDTKTLYSCENYTI